MAWQNGTGAAPQSDAGTNQPDAENGRGTERDRVVFPVDSQVVADPGGTRLLEQGHPAFPQPRRPPRHWRRWVVLGSIVVLALGAGTRWGFPYVREALETVSTDDAFVAGHITNVGPRIDDVVAEVRVDRTDRVEPGDLLIRLDPQPYAVRAAEARAAVEQARAEGVQARARVRAQLAEARSSFYRRRNAQERIREQTATLHARVASLRARESSAWLAEVDQKRIENLVRRGSATQAELDQRNNTLKNAREEVAEARAEVQETRAALGLVPDAADPLQLPADLDVQQSTVQSAVSAVTSSMAEIGIVIDPARIAEVRAFGEFLRPEGGRATGEGLDAVIEQAPAVRVALASLHRAERALDEAQLQLSYTEIRSEIAGYVQDRSVNPGDRVQPGQTLVSIRPDHVWIEANFKETQLRYIRIGMPVDLYVDAYPRRVFRGRVSGFSPGTGLAASLLPPENATGNYVKVTQRLPVRIELAEPNPRDTPLFVGLSVVPYVRYQGRPSGPGAGLRLHAEGQPVAPPDVGAGPAGRPGAGRR